MNKINLLEKLKNKIKAKPIRNNLTVFDDDVFLVSYPRSGNTWTRFLIGTVISGIKVNWENMETVIPDIYRNTNKQLLKIKRPRILKSHHPFDTRYNKVIYIVRDVRDVIISYKNYFDKFNTNKTIVSMDRFIDKFILGELDDFGSWDENVNSWLRNRDKVMNGFLLLKYEDLKSDTYKSVNEILSFLGIEKTNNEIKDAIRWASFENMKKLEKEQNDSWLFKNSNKTIPFMRSGKSGEWIKVFNKKELTKINNKFSELLLELGYKL